jgi:hypothetical protein
MSHDDEDDELSPEARAALERWSPPGPPAGFAERVVAAGIIVTDTVSSRPDPGRRPRWPLVVAGVAAAGALAMFGWPASPLPDVAVASRAYAARETVALGGRGVAVVEPGTTLAWRRDGRGLAVEQRSGDVFYRVDRAGGAPFVVTTPAGDVRVTGTCFRVEVLPMVPRSSLIGAAAGAVIATAAVVTVYEGKVIVASPGGKAEVQAGERVTLDGSRPMPAPDVPGPGPSVAIQVPPEPSAAITREELLVRDKAQREQIAVLSTRLAQLEGAVAAGGARIKKGGPSRLDGEDWIDPTKEELMDLAKECGVKIDVPPIMRGEPMQFSTEDGEAAGMSNEELVTANQVIRDLAQAWRTRVRGWYIEATGDVAGGDQLSAHGMGEELQDKAIPGEPQAVQRKISYERAGMAVAPADLSKLSPFERYFRGFAGLGDEAERLLADKHGPDKAHRLRADDGGWPMRMGMAGCDRESGTDAEAER